MSDLNLTPQDVQFLEQARIRESVSTPPAEQDPATYWMRRYAEEKEKVWDVQRQRDQIEARYDGLVLALWGAGTLAAFVVILMVTRR